MKQEGKAKRQLSNNLLIAILVILILLIIGLIVGIVVININNGQNQGNNGSTTTVVSNDAAKAQAEEDEAYVRELNQEIMQMSDFDEAQAFLDEELAEHQDDSKAFRIKVMKMWVYINGGEADQAVPIAESINEDELDDYQKLKFYAVLNRMYQDLGDEEASQNYVTKWNDMHEKIYGGLQF